MQCATYISEPGIKQSWYADKTTIEISNDKAIQEILKLKQVELLPKSALGNKSLMLNSFEEWVEEFARFAFFTHLVKTFGE